MAWAAALCLVGACSEPQETPPARTVQAAPTSAPTFADGGSATATPQTLTIDVTAQDYRWHLAYPGPDGVLGSSDDVLAQRDIHVPSHTHVVLRLHSRDFVYKLRLPHVPTSEIAVPDQEFAIEFESGPPGHHELRGDQFCGFSHPELIGTLHVESPEEFSRWMSDADATTERTGTTGR